MTQLDQRTSATSNAYIMEHPDESARLEGKTDPLRDRQQLELIGLRPGMTVLDVGGGTGAVARTMAEVVGPSGQVTVMDRSEERLRFGEAAAKRAALMNISFTCHDIMSTPFVRGHFDLVWSRFTFEYLSDPVAALANLAQYVRVGGKVVVADLDGNGVVQYPTNAIVQRGNELVLQCVNGLFDPYVGRKLVHYFHNAKLQVGSVHVLPYHIYAGRAEAADLENWTRKLQSLRARCIPAFGCDHDFDRYAAEYLRQLTTPGVFMYSTLIIVEGTRDV
jgi:ubiquinone/menaquinone biosynthesis C-methylase UbiE